MEACFENRYTITKKLYLHWVNHSSARILSAIICSIFLVICTGLFISSIVNMYGFVAPFYLFFMLLGLYLIFLHTRIVAAKQFDRLALLQGGSEWLRIVRLAEDAIAVEDGNSTTQFRWDQVIKVMPDRDELVLFFNKDSKLRLAKNGFTVGNCDAFLDFVRAKYPHLL